MLQKLIFCLTAFFITHSCLACTCHKSEHFNLVDYDFYEHIFEVKVKSKYTPDLDSLKNDTTNSPSLYEYDLLNGYNISMIEVFKGDLKLTEKVMGFPDFSSCSWAPEIGNTYIFYANSLNGVEMCNRILIKKYDEKEFLQEKSILCSLMDSPSKVKIELDSKVVIEGYHVEDLRDGTWKIYSMDKENKIVFKLVYKKGDLLSIKKDVGYSEQEEWHSSYYYYYTEQIKS